MFPSKKDLALFRWARGCCCSSMLLSKLSSINCTLFLENSASYPFDLKKFWALDRIADRSIEAMPRSDLFTTCAEPADLFVSYSQSCMLFITIDAPLFISRHTFAFK